MSTPTATRGALLRRAGTLLVAAVLVGAPATTAFADPTPSPGTDASATASPSSSASATPSPPPSSTAEPAEPTPSDTSTPSPDDPQATTPGTSTTTPDAVPSAPSALVPGGRSRLAARAAAAGPSTTTNPAGAAAHYLEQQLAATGFLLQSYGYPDHGLTADAILALDAAGTGQDAAAAATAKLLADPVAYTGFGDPAEVYAGAVAKLLNVAVSQGSDPTAFGGVDLVTTLQGLEHASGRFSDVSAWGDYSNTFGQSFALIGLHRVGAPVSAAARGYLLEQQCPGGGFKLYMDDSGCTADADADPDATAMAVQALVAVGGSDAEVGEALDFLAASQGASGGVTSPAQGGVNANTTGLAGQAFLAGGRSAQADAAVAYLTSLQYGCTFPAAIRGGIAYDEKSYDGQEAAGDEATPVDIDRRSTTQAMLALSGTPLASVTAEGATAQAPELSCTDTEEPTDPPTDDDTTGGGGSGGGSGDSGDSGGSEGSGSSDSSGSSGADTGTSAATGSLAQTGSDLLTPALVGLALVVLGGVAVAASARRRGVHS